MKNILKLILSLLFLNIGSNVLAFGVTGHRVIAEIAENHLSGKAKREIRKIIGNQSLAYHSNWSDFVKSNPSYKHADSWHFINFPAEQSRIQFDEILKTSTTENLYKRTLLLCEQLKDRKELSEKEKQEALYFLIHLIGDAHQPLHLGREEDLGGNKLEVKWFKNTTNLHSVWDTKMVDFQKYSYTEFAAVLDIHSRKRNRELASGSLEDWLFDSYQKSERIYSTVKAGDNLGYKYDYENVDLLEEQLLKGGLRLAKLLNEVFK